MRPSQHRMFPSTPSPQRRCRSTSLSHPPITLGDRRYLGCTERGFLGVGVRLNVILLRTELYACAADHMQYGHHFEPPDGTFSGQQGGEISIKSLVGLAVIAQYINFDLMSCLHFVEAGLGPVFPDATG